MSVMLEVSQLPLTVHTAEVKLANPRELVSNTISDLIGSRDVALQIFKRDLKGQFRTSLLGVLLPLLPALTTAAWAILFRDAGLIKVGGLQMPYPFFVLTGMMLWASYLEALDAPIAGVREEQNLISKADVPVEAITMARLAMVFFNFAMKCVVLVGAELLYRIPISWTIIFTPLIFLLMVLLGAGIGLILAPLNMLYSDVGKALPVVTTFWFFTSPIIFTSPGKGWAAFLMNRVNPVTPLLTTIRELAFSNHLSMLPGLIVAGALALVLFSLGLLFHRIAMPIVIDRSNS